MRPSALRQAVAAHLMTQLGPAGWAESTFPYPLFPNMESRYGLHRTFAVGVDADSPVQSRQRVSSGLSVISRVVVRFALSTDGGSLEAYDGALDAEADMVAALAALKTDAGVTFAIAGVPTRTISGDGTVYLGEVMGAVQHTYPLSPTSP